MFQEFTSELKILGARRALWSFFHADDPQILGAAENLVATATWRPEFVHPYNNVRLPSFIPDLLSSPTFPRL
jgi:hypothetical protein